MITNGHSTSAKITVPNAGKNRSVNRRRRRIEMATVQEKYQKLVSNFGVAIALCLLVLSASSIAPAAIEMQSYDWESSRELYPGIRYTHTEPSVPRKIVVNCLQIDSHTLGFEVLYNPTSHKMDRR